MRLHPLIPAAFILTMAIIGSARQRAHTNMVLAERDSLVSSFQRFTRLRQSGARAGDSVPGARVVSRNGDTLRIRDLTRRGVRYFYFYSDECIACRTIAPLMNSMPTDVRDRTAFIHLGYKLQRTPSPERNHYAWVVDSTVPRPVGSVPSLLVAQDSQWLAATADFDARSVLSLMVLHRLIAKHSLDSALRAASTPQPLAALEP